jgi:hypothetical protein
MFGLFNSLFSSRPERAKRSPVAEPRRLEFQPLESRDLMATIPALSSLPNAPKTLYLDFDGDTQLVWNRTDETPQIYRNVKAGEFNIDGQAGISDAEAAAIRKIWETVADDYAPFNINVTTVAPSSFQNGTALRVVMAGDCTAQLVTGRNTSLAVSGDRFIWDSAAGELVDTSGHASINSFRDAEPNVVYVFAKYMSTWDMVDSEGHSRDLRAIIATTASHEAGHSFGLVHHGDYDVGSAITTPIMGSNTQGDRTVWSQYGYVLTDSVAKLTSKLGARPDDFGDKYQTATQVQFKNNGPILGYGASFKGVVGTLSDVDMFALKVTSATTYSINVTGPQFGNLDSQLVLFRVTKMPFNNYIYYTIATVDPQISSIQPFQGLGASLSITLQPGSYAIAVKSHGTYGDLGNYTLSVSHSSILIDPVITQAVAGTSLSSNSTSPGVVPTAINVSAIANPVRFGSAGAGGSTSSPLTTKSKLSTAAVDAIFGDWANEGAKLQRHLQPTA